MKNIFYYFSMFTLALGFAVVFLFGYWSLYPYKVLTFGQNNGVIKKDTVKPGGYIEMIQEDCKWMQLEGRISRQFIDSVVYQVPLIVSNRKIGCSKTPEMIYIPKALTPGVYYINTTITYKVNPIREVTYTVRTNEFTIISNGIK